jgi:CRISPR-associated endonuclease/helicase Cas3
METVFDRDASRTGPAASDQTAPGNSLSEAGIAAQNVLDLRRGYSIDAGLWDPDTNTPTRLEERPQTTLRLACLRNGVITPYAADVDPLLAWAQSEVSVAQFRIATCPLPAELEIAVNTAKAQWGRWEWDSPIVVLALLRQEGDGYSLEVCAESGTVVVARYDVRTGPSWPEAKPAPARDDPVVPLVGALQVSRSPPSGDFPMLNTSRPRH